MPRQSKHANEGYYEVAWALAEQIKSRFPDLKVKHRTDYESCNINAKLPNGRNYYIGVRRDTPNIVRISAYQDIDLSHPNSCDWALDLAIGITPRDEIAAARDQIPS